MSARALYAKTTLRHYFSLLFENSEYTFDSDSHTDIESIVDNIIDAAVEVAKYELKKEIDPRRA